MQLLPWAAQTAVLDFWIHYYQQEIEDTCLTNNVILHYQQFVPKFTCQTMMLSGTAWPDQANS